MSTDTTRQVYAEDLWAAHEAWCAENGVPAHAVVAQVQRVAAVLTDRGCDRARRQIKGERHTVWLGVRLKVEPTNDCGC